MRTHAGLNAHFCLSNIEDVTVKCDERVAAWPLRNCLVMRPCELGLMFRQWDKVLDPHLSSKRDAARVVLYVESVAQCASEFANCCRI